jgi:hypothetical protein
VATCKAAQGEELHCVNDVKSYVFFDQSFACEAHASLPLLRQLTVDGCFLLGYWQGFAFSLSLAFLRGEMG